MYIFGVQLYLSELELTCSTKENREEEVDMYLFQIEYILNIMYFSRDKGFVD